MEFRQVTTSEISAAHALYLGVAEWLKARGIRQWLRPLTKEEFAERQGRGELFAGFADGRMIATVSVAFEEDTDWLAHLSRDKRWWIKTLAVSRADHGQGLGAAVIGKCEAFIRETGPQEVYLECVDAGFLPRYYEQLGYEVLIRAEITYPSGNTFPVALMRKRLR
jgi:ribosomal protein S18 acetylase RimI-like enzyme